MRKKLQLRQKTTVVVCPTAKLPAEVKLDTNLRMESCSRRADFADCTETCMPQIQFSPDGLEDFAARYGGKPCLCCGAALKEEDWYKNRLDALRSDGEMPTPNKFPLTVFIAPEGNKSPLCSACYSSHRSPGPGTRVCAQATQ